MDRYSYEAELGAGGYGSVWLCTERDTGGLVAIKRFKDAHLDPEVMRIALREVRILKSLKHRNVVKILEAFRSKSGRVYLVMEYVERTITTDIANNPHGLPPAQVKLFMWQLCQAVACLHKKKVMHRDLKPANILVSNEGVVKLCDFGFARALHAKETSDYSSYVVTRWYRPPEVIVNDLYGPAIDIWALGCILAELATGRPLLPGDTNLDQLAITIKLVGRLSHRQMTLIAHDEKLRGVDVPPPSVMGRIGLEARFLHFAPEMKQFLRASLAPDPANRMTAEQLLSLPYFADVYALLPQLAETNPAAYSVHEDLVMPRRTPSPPPKLAVVPPADAPTPSQAAQHPRSPSGGVLSPGAGHVPTPPQQARPPVPLPRRNISSRDLASSPTAPARRPISLGDMAAEPPASSASPTAAAHHPADPQRPSSLSIIEQQQQQQASPARRVPAGQDRPVVQSPGGTLSAEPQRCATPPGVAPPQEGRQALPCGRTQGAGEGGTAESNGPPPALLTKLVAQQQRAGAEDEGTGTDEGSGSNSHAQYDEWDDQQDVGPCPTNPRARIKRSTSGMSNWSFGSAATVYSVAGETSNVWTPRASMNGGMSFDESRKPRRPLSRGPSNLTPNRNSAPWASETDAHDEHTAPLSRQPSQSSSALPRIGSSDFRARLSNSGSASLRNLVVGRGVDVRTLSAGRLVLPTAGKDHDGGALSPDSQSHAHSSPLHGSPTPPAASTSVHFYSRLGSSSCNELVMDADGATSASAAAAAAANGGTSGTVSIAHVSRLSSERPGAVAALQVASARQRFSHLSGSSSFSSSGSSSVVRGPPGRSATSQQLQQSVDSIVRTRTSCIDLVIYEDGDRHSNGRSRSMAQVSFGGLDLDAGGEAAASPERFCSDAGYAYPVPPAKDQQSSQQLQPSCASAAAGLLEEDSGEGAGSVAESTPAESAAANDQGLAGGTASTSADGTASAAGGGTVAAAAGKKKAGVSNVVKKFTARIEALMSTGPTSASST